MLAAFSSFRAGTEAITGVMSRAKGWAMTTQATAVTSRGAAAVRLRQATCMMTRAESRGRSGTMTVVKMSPWAKAARAGWAEAGMVRPNWAASGRKISPTKGTVTLKPARVTMSRMRDTSRKKNLVPMVPRFSRALVARTVMRHTARKTSKAEAAQALRSRARMRAIQA